MPKFVTAEPPVYALMRWLDDEYQRSQAEHRGHPVISVGAPTGKSPPVGTSTRRSTLYGGAHMDPFFRCEAIRGMLGALRAGKSVEDAVKEGAGAVVCEIAVQLWNIKREWQVHRWAGFAEDYLLELIRRYDATIGEQR